MPFIYPELRTQHLPSELLITGDSFMEHRNLGYTIRREGQAIRFEHRALYGPAIASAVLGGLTLILGLNALIWLLPGTAETPLPMRLTIVGVLGSLALVAGIAASVAYRGYRWRRALPSDAATTLIADLATGQLLTPDGRTLAPLSALSFSQPFDPLDSIQGFMHFLVLHWPDGTQRIYKSGRRGELDALQAELEAAGVGKPR